MLPDGRPFGAHLPLGPGMVRAVDRAREIGATALQIFADNPTAWRRRSAPPAEQPAFRERLAMHGIGPVAIHAAYLVNLAGPDPEFFARSVDVLAQELRAARGYGATLVNVHTGSHRDAGRSAGIARLTEGVERVLDAAGDALSGPGAPMLVLENLAGGGHTLGVTIEELAEIAESLDARGVPPQRVGFCLDTAHLWGAGYDLSDPDAVERLLDAFDARIGLDRLAMLHLNDSKAERGSRLDRHEHLGAGGIAERGMAHLLTAPRLAAVPTFIETPGMDEGYDAVNLERALVMARGESPAPLPPEAFALRGARARTPPEPEPEIA